jgi:16S rRNA (cytosine1402-N4)-methyltransferase
LYIDGTFGRGGHSREILRRLGEKARLVALDRDPQAVRTGEQTLAHDRRFEIVRGEIADLGKIAAERDLLGKVDGLLLDLGVSSPQLDEAQRGFSFQKEGPLDMRMDPAKGQSAAQWLAAVDEQTLKKVLYQFGEERHAPRIAHALVEARRNTPITSTTQLAELVAGCVPARAQKTHPATKTFQAIRIVINDELQQLDAALAVTPSLLRSGGRLCVISFHSLEDRRVKRFMRTASRDAEHYRGMPTVPEQFRAPLRVLGKAHKATPAEIDENPRARSARLRIAERI